MSDVDIGPRMPKMYESRVLHVCAELASILPWIKLAVDIAIGKIITIMKVTKHNENNARLL